MKEFCAYSHVKYNHVAIISEKTSRWATTTIHYSKDEVRMPISKTVRVISRQRTSIETLSNTIGEKIRALSKQKLKAASMKNAQRKIFSEALLSYYNQNCLPILK